MNTWQKKTPGYIVVVFIASFLLSGCSFQSSKMVMRQASQRAQEQVSPIPIADGPFSASFEIYTNGYKRTFNQSKYYNQSPNAYIDESDPNQFLVTNKNSTWNDFFSSLPFSLTEDCLVTGTSQQFCNSDSHQLVFTLNGEQDDKVLQKVIKPRDKLVITYQLRVK